MILKKRYYNILPEFKEGKRIKYFNQEGKLYGKYIIKSSKIICFDYPDNESALKIETTKGYEVIFNRYLKPRIVKKKFIFMLNDSKKEIL